MSDNEDKRKSLPEGRVINNSMFVKDLFKGKEAYRVEMAYGKDAADEIFDLLADFAEETWGAGAREQLEKGDIRCPLKDGDAMAKDREGRGKSGEAYVGMEIIRAKTDFNLNGDDGPGGITVYDRNVVAIDPVNKSEIFNGCYGILGCTFSAYEDEYKDKDGNTIKRPAITVYISAFQKTKDGERLVSQSDHSSLFKPVAGGGTGDSGRTRRTRKG